MHASRGLEKKKKKELCPPSSHQLVTHQNVSLIAEWPEATLTKKINIVNGLVGMMQASQQIIQRDRYLMIAGKTRGMRGGSVILTKMESVLSACQVSLSAQLLRS